MQIKEAVGWIFIWIMIGKATDWKGRQVQPLHEIAKNILDGPSGVFCCGTTDLQKLKQETNLPSDKFST